MRELGPSIDRVRPFYQRAVEILEHAYGPDDPRVALVLTNLGTLEADDGALWSAEEAYLRALRIQHHWFGVHDPRVTDTLTRLAATADPVGWWGRLRPEQARGRYQDLLVLQNQAFGPDDPRVADTLAALAETWYGPDDPEADVDAWQDTAEELHEARRLIERALHIQLQAYGARDGRVADTRNCLANVLSQLSEHGQGLEPDQLERIRAEPGCDAGSLPTSQPVVRPRPDVIDLSAQLLADTRDPQCRGHQSGTGTPSRRRRLRLLASRNQRLINQLDPDTGWAELDRVQFPILRRAYTVLWATPAIGLALAWCLNDLGELHMGVGLVHLSFTLGWVAAFVLSAAEFHRSRMIRTLFPAVFGLSAVAFGDWQNLWGPLKWARAMALCAGLAALAVLATRPFPKPPAGVREISHERD